MATTIGVPTAQYAPWAVFCYGGPIFSLLIAATYRFTRFGIRQLAESRSASVTTVIEEPVRAMETR